MNSEFEFFFLLSFFVLYIMLMHFGMTFLFYTSHPLFYFSFIILNVPSIFQFFWMYMRFLIMLMRLKLILIIYHNFISHMLNISSWMDYEGFTSLEKWRLDVVVFLVTLWESLSNEGESDYVSHQSFSSPLSSHPTNYTLLPPFNANFIKILSCMSYKSTHTHNQILINI